MAYLDPVSNFGKGTITNPPGIDAAATSFTVGSTQGANFPAASLGVSEYYCVIHNATDYTDAADDPNREIVRVRTRSTDSFSNVVRGQLGTAAAAHNTAGKTYLLTLTPTSDLRDKIDARIDGPRTAFRAKMTADQVVGGGATATVNFIAEDYDVSSEFDTATKRFKAKKAGIYSFYASAIVTWTNGDTWAMRLQKNPSAANTTVERTRFVVNGSSGTIDVSGQLSLAVDDEISVEVVAGTNGGTINGTGTDDGTRFIGASTGFYAPA